MSDTSYADAISSIESGGRYGILGPVTKSGDRAYGKYQVMGNNIGPWSKEILGQEVSPDQFLADPQIQDAVFQGKFGQYVQKYGNPQDAASAWFTGQPLSKGANRADLYGTTGQSYVDRFNKALASSGGAAPAQAQPAPMQVAQQSAPSFPQRQPASPVPMQTQQQAQAANPYLPGAQNMPGMTTDPTATTQTNPFQQAMVAQMQMRRPLQLSGLASLLSGSPAIQRLISQG